MKAVTILAAGKAGVTDIPEQSMRPTYVKLKTVALAINPTDYHHTSGVGDVGGILGCDVAGIVEEVGSECKTDVKKGDRVAGVVHGANNDQHEDGAYAEYAMIKDGAFLRIPSYMSFEEAAPLGVGIVTIAQALYLTLKFPLPGTKEAEEARSKPEGEKEMVLIYGGSTASGSLAIQFAKLSGLHVVTTCSPSNFELVKSKGADVAFDYNDPDCGRKIREYTKNSLCYAMDNISMDFSYKIVAEAFPQPQESSNGEPSKDMHLVTLLPLDTWPRKDVDAQAILAYTSVGESFHKFGTSFPAVPEHYELSKRFFKLCERLLEERKLAPHPVLKGEAGLYGIPAGIQKVGTRGVSGKKLVFLTEDTWKVDPSTIQDHSNMTQVLEKW